MIQPLGPNVLNALVILTYGFVVSGSRMPNSNGSDAPAVISYQGVEPPSAFLACPDVSDGHCAGTSPKRNGLSLYSPRHPGKPILAYLFVTIRRSYVGAPGAVDLSALGFHS